MIPDNRMIRDNRWEAGSRWFLAVTPPAAALEELNLAVARPRDSHPGIAWSDPAGWHITVAFFGAVDDDRRAELSAALAGAASRVDPVSLCLAGSGHFGSRVLWAGVAGDVDGLRALADVSRAAARGVHVEADPRPFQPHLTIGHAWRRERDAGGMAVGGEEPVDPPDIGPPRAALSGFHGTSWLADRLLLMSAPSQGRSYPVVKSWALRGGAAGQA